MLGLVVMMFMVSSLMGSRNAGRIVKAFFAFMAVIYGMRILLYMGFHFIPVIIIFWLIAKVAVPFLKGFFASFNRGRA